jgi:hypothetical protein
MKLDVPNLVSALTPTPIFGWCPVGCETKNIHQKRDHTMCPRFVNNLDIEINILEGTCMIIYEVRESSL